MRLFASVDLIGSTAYKNSFTENVKDYQKKRPPWVKGFEAFYLNFAETLRDRCRSSAVLGGADCRGMGLFKAIGDELVFVQVIKDHREAIEYARAIRDALNKYNQQLTDEQLPLRVKGCLWIAGFPINNAEVVLPDNLPTDYLGPSIDAGFRIAKYASKRKMMISVDLALLLTASVRTGAERPNDLEFYFDGTESLKGVLDGRPYPLVWIAATEVSDEERLLGTPKSPCDVAHLHRYCQSYIQQDQETGWLIPPYLKNDPQFSIPCKWHKQILDHWKVSDQQAAAVPATQAEENTKSSDVTHELGNVDVLLGDLVLKAEAISTPPSKS